MSAAFDPCQPCGACCAHYRVSFYWAEGEGLPEPLVEGVTPVLACMAGTNQAQPRCIALQGSVGSGTRCTIYPMRPSPCREVQPGDDRCRRARLAHGLPVATG